MYTVQAVFQVFLTHPGLLWRRRSEVLNPGWFDSCIHLTEFRWCSDGMNSFQCIRDVDSHIPALDYVQRDCCLREERNRHFKGASNVSFRMKWILPKDRCFFPLTARKPRIAKTSSYTISHHSPFVSRSDFWNALLQYSMSETTGWNKEP